MRRISEISQLPVLSIQDGTYVEKVCRAAVNPVSRGLEYLAFAGTPWYEPPFMLHWSRVRSIGRDMITIRSRKDIVQVNEELRRELSSTVELAGLRVFDSSGLALGSVADLAVDETTGKLLKLYLGDGSTLDIGTVVTIGTNAVITEAAASEPAPPAKPVGRSEFQPEAAAAAIPDERGGTAAETATAVAHIEIEASPAIASTVMESVTMITDADIAASAAAGDPSQQEKSFIGHDFLLGKIAVVDIYDEHGNTIIGEGTVITEKEIEAARAGGALYDLVTGVV